MIHSQTFLAFLDWVCLFIEKCVIKFEITIADPWLVFQLPEIDLRLRKKI